MTEYTQTTGYIACDPNDGDHIADHNDVELRQSWDGAMNDRTDEKPAVRRVAPDGYLYVD